jgi:alginate O-acetyltransferase complex protein AlgI
LTTWFRDYVYIPLGGNRKGFARTVFNMLVVWVLTGLWHGASWNFILWGLYYFVLLFLEKLITPDRLQRIPSTIRHGMVLLLVMGGWIIFRLESLPQIGQAFAGLFQFNGQSVSFLVSHHDAMYPLFLILPSTVGCFPVVPWIRKKLPESFSAYLSTALDIALFAVCIALLLGASYNPFIYFRF